jgi:hypothetical protein
MRTELPQAPACGPRRADRPELWSISDRRWDRVRGTLVVGWLLVVAASLLVGERTASWAEVQALVVCGQVETVRVSGELPARATGYGHVEVHWRHGLLRYTTEVVQVRGRGSAVAARAAGDGAPVLHASPTSRLVALQPALQVTRDQSRSSGGPLFGWQVPNGVGIAAFLLCLGGLYLMVAGPEPWRATRWAWFWLVLTSPFVSVLFLLLSGPTVAVPGPRNPRRRLTGGWAFLLSLPLMGALGR